MKNSFETIKTVMYKTLKKDVLPELDMEDLEQVWITLIIFWNLEQYFIEKEKKEDWKKFIDEINCKKSEDQKWFNQTFEKYF